MIFLGLAASSFAQNISNRFLFIEGTAENEEHLQFFLDNFTIEARTSGYTIPKKKRDAAYIFSFSVSPNTTIINDVEVPASPGDNQYVLKITLTKNNSEEETLSFNFYFSELSEMYEYNQFLFQRATVYIPPATVSELVDRSWQNKWLYIRLSFDYPIIFHALQPTGLIGGLAVYSEGPEGKPDEFNTLDNKIQPQPGATVGIEFQFLKFMSLEANFKAVFGDTSDYSFINWIAGGQLKFPIKTKYLIFQPYAAYNYNLNISDIFSEFPVHSIGGGLQFAARGGKVGAFFVDVSYMHFLGEVVMYNPFAPLPFPLPEVIYYKRFVIGLSAGYKFGLINRRSR